MNRIAILVLTTCLVLTVTASHSQSVIDKAKRDEVTRVPDNDPEMAKAFRKAQTTLDGFLAIARSPSPHMRSVSVKVAVSDTNDTEYFWVTPFTENDGYFRGRISNNPRLVKNVSLNDEIKFERSRIVDWMYVDTLKKKMHGNFTACALLKHEPPSEAEKFRKQFGLECDL